MKQRIDQLLELHQNDPEDSFIIFALAKEYDNQGDPEIANQYYLRLREKDPDYTGLYYHLGKNFEILDQPEEARTVYQTGIEICKRQRDLHAESELRSALTNLELEL